MDFLLQSRFLSLRGVLIYRDDAAIYPYRTVEIASLRSQ